MLARLHGFFQAYVLYESVTLSRMLDDDGGSTWVSSIGLVIHVASIGYSGVEKNSK